MREQIAGQAEASPEEKQKTIAPATPPPDFSPESVLALLKMPFIYVEAVTGYHYEIPKDQEPILAQTGAQVMQDFGIELVGKWINLAVFAGTYGICGWTCYQGVKHHRELLILQAKKEAEIQKQKEKENFDEIQHGFGDRDKGFRKDASG